MPAKAIEKFDVLVILAVLIIGAVNLPQPLNRDQILFTMAASEISDGGLLYKDFWEGKQPGIHLFYLLAGKIFGFNEVGIHLFELLYMVLLSIILTLTLKSSFQNPTIGSLIPLLTVGIYYGSTGPWHLTQVEALVGFPMFLSLWFSSRTSETGGKPILNFFISGLLGSVTLLFKLVFLPIILSFWGIAIYYASMREKYKIQKIFAHIAVPVFIGAMVPLLIVFIYFAYHGELQLLYFTFFEFPASVLRYLSASKVHILIGGLRWYTGMFASLIALGALGACAALITSKKNIIMLGSVFWYFFGFGVILLQRLSWWEYHYMLLIIPTGILATKGLDILWPFLKKLDLKILPKYKSAIALMFICLLFLPILQNFTTKFVYLFRYGFAINRTQRIKYQTIFNTNIKKVLDEVDFLTKPDSISGDIYVIGNTRYYYLSGRKQAVPINAGSPEILLYSQWSQIAKNIKENLPPYIFIQDQYVGITKQRAAELISIINDNYRILKKSRSGIWYFLENSNDN